MRFPPRARLLVAGLACVAAYAVVVEQADLDHRGPLTALFALAWSVFAAGAVWTLRVPDPRGRPDPGGRPAAGTPSRRRRWNRGPLLVVVFLAALCQLPGVLGGQRLSNDAYRYVWDGRVQLAGTSPYRYVPLDDHLARLRDPLLFPGLTPAQSSGVRTVPLPSDKRALADLARDDPRTLINRPAVPTIYPPVAEAWFTVVAAATPWAWGTHGLQIGSALLAIGLTVLLGRWLTGRGRDARMALVWGWSPTAVLESGSGAHVDIVATAFVVLAVVVAGSARPTRRILAGAFLGLAVAAKLVPVVLLPAFAARRARSAVRQRFVTPAVAIGTAALTYLPHLLIAGWLVLGYLPGYATEEGFDDGSGRYAVLGVVLPDAARRPVALGLGLLVVLVALRRTVEARPQQTAVWLLGCAVLIGTPGYPWYCLSLVALAVLAGRLEWLAVAAASYLVYAEYGALNRHLPGIAYGAAGLVVLGVTVLRVRSDRADLGEQLLGQPGVGDEAVDEATAHRAG